MWDNKLNECYIVNENKKKFWYRELYIYDLLWRKKNNVEELVIIVNRYVFLIW